LSWRVIKQSFDTHQLSLSGKTRTNITQNAKNFHHISNQTIVINAARGGVIVEDIWQKTPTKANVIDCWENEPNINQNLHVAGH
jgi:erythronate-4-phosphate dehydrogenase